jgi:alpha-1,3-fucosyltransferase
MTLDQNILENHITTFRAPTFVRENLNRFDNYYNMTMTYRLDSDVVWDYGKIVSAETNEVIAPSKNPDWKSPDDSFFGKKIHHSTVLQL